MTKIGDERVRFYMENREQIDQWASLRREAINAVYTVFQQLEGQLGEVVKALEGAPVLQPFLDGRYPAYALVDPSWPTCESGRPRIGLTLEMDRDTPFEGSSVLKIYVGVRVENSRPADRDLHEAVLKEAASTSAYSKKATRWWPCWRYIRSPDERWWEDSQAFEETLITALDKAWDDLRPVVTRALQHLGELAETVDQLDADE